MAIIKAAIIGFVGGTVIGALVGLVIFLVARATGHEDPETWMLVLTGGFYSALLCTPASIFVTLLQYPTKASMLISMIFCGVLLGWIMGQGTMLLHPVVACVLLAAAGTSGISRKLAA